jgi:isoquinoline 1-oxidoreductase subunit beta
VDLKPEQVEIHTVYAGGSFGRRGCSVSEAVEVAKAIGASAPVKLVWTREDDIRGGGYRPMYVHKLAAGLDAQGNLIAWHHRIVGQSILSGTPYEARFVKNGIDLTSVAGASTMPYDIPNILVELHTTKVGVPVRTWRSVPSSHTAFAVEVFLDEIAYALGRDPYDFRRALLAQDPRDKRILELVAPDGLRDALFVKHPRDRQVLELAAEKARWGTPLPPGKGRGIAVHYSFRTSVAQVAEVTVGSDGKVKVDRVVCAVDCGVAVNPDVIRAQVEGGIGFGLGAVLHSAITLKDGAVEQSNFHDYQVLRIDEMPRVEVHIVPSHEPPTGIAEPVVPPIGPAVANAVFAATGKHLRTLPFARSQET